MQMISIENERIQIKKVAGIFAGNFFEHILY